MPSIEHGPATIIGQQPGARFLALQMLVLKLAAIDQRESEPIGEERSELLHQIERQGWSSWSLGRRALSRRS